MSQIVGLINGTENENRDYHYSLGLTSIIEPGVISGLELSQIGSNVSITSGEAVVKVTRTSITPNEVFCVAFLSTATESVTINANDYVYIEINPTRVNDPALNVESTGTGIGEIVAGGTLPTNNYIILGRADGSGNIQTTGRQSVRLKQQMTSADKITGGNWKILYTNGSGEVKELSFGTAGQVLGFTGANSTPVPISPSVDINRLTEDVTGNMELDELVKNNGTGPNTKIKVSTYRASDIEAKNGTENIKFITPKQAKDNYGVVTNGKFTSISESWVSTNKGGNTSTSKIINTITVCELLLYIDSSAGNSYAKIQKNNGGTWQDLYVRTSEGTTDGIFLLSPGEYRASVNMDFSSSTTRTFIASIKYTI